MMASPKKVFNITCHYYPIGSMYGIYANIWGILMVKYGIHVTIYSSTMDPMGTLRWTNIAMENGPLK